MNQGNEQKQTFSYEDIDRVRTSLKKGFRDYSYCSLSRMAQDADLSKEVTRQILETQDIATKANYYNIAGDELYRLKPRGFHERFQDFWYYLTHNI